MQFVTLTHRSPEFNAAYDVISRDIPPACLETSDFLRNRLRVREEGPKSEREKLLLQDGYTLHLIAAREGSKIVGALYGHLISRITDRNKAIGFVTYLAVRREYRKCGIGTGLIFEFQRIIDHDAHQLTGKPVFGMVYEIEGEGKQEIKALVSKLGAKPLDIVYYQPALRPGYGPERMDLWFQPAPPLSLSDAVTFSLPAGIVEGMVRNMLAMEYVGPELKGFDQYSKPFSAFLESMQSRKEIGFRTL